jgi:hypothetical protein
LRSAFRCFVVGNALALVFLFGAADAAVDYPGVYRGDQCGKVYSAFGIKWSVSWNGAKACVEQGYLAPGLFFNITPVAYDAQKNGHSALNDWRVLQLQGLTWRLYKRGTCIISTGYGWSKVCDEEKITRLANASRVAIQIRACNYEAPTAQRVDCSGYITRSNRAWSQIP